MFSGFGIGDGNMIVKVLSRTERIEGEVAAVGRCEMGICAMKRC
jgi:hypothetical protein